jgi:hypothetical protein
MLIDALTLEGPGDDGEGIDGIELAQLPPGTTILMRTVNSFYRFLLMASPEVCIQGGRYFPRATSAFFDGASAGGSGLRVGWIGVGLHAEFHSAGQRIVTSRIRSIAAIRADAAGARTFERCVEGLAGNDRDAD